MEQQQETWKLPEAFVARMKAMLGDACDIFLASYKKERVCRSKSGFVFPATGILVPGRLLL